MKTMIYKILALPLCKISNPKDKLPKDILISVNLNMKLVWFDGTSKMDGVCVELGELLKFKRRLSINGSLTVAKEPIQKWSL
jgi:hypothetical protein